jgi:hypothetical protein
MLSLVASKGLRMLIKTTSKLALHEVSQRDFALTLCGVLPAYCISIVAGCSASSARRRSGREYFKFKTL